MTTFEGPALDLGSVGALTLGGFLQEVCGRFGAAEALVFDDPLLGGETVRWSYDRLLVEARTAAKALLALGVEPGESVGVLMGNRPEAVASLFGAAMAGAVAVPMSTFSPRPELEHMLRLAEVTVVLTQERLLARRFGEDLAALVDDLPHLRHVAVLGTPTWASFLDGAGRVDDRALDGRIASVHADDPGLVIFSSGTTSAPKGMLHGHRAPTLQSWVQAQIFGRHPGTRMWTALPIFWTAGFNTAMGATLAAGGCWVVQETFEPGEALALMAREAVTEPYALPHQIAALAEHPDWVDADLSSLTCVYGKSAIARHPSVDGDPGWIMPVGWGLSETCAFFVAHPSDTPREVMRRSTGAILAGNRLRVLDPETGEALGIGAEGELAVAGPTLFQGYLGQDRSPFDADGFFRTGDAGHVDELGEVHFAGRRTEMIKTAGANVSPAELEVQLRACPPVKLARVVGVPDPRVDQLVVACITLRDGETATEDDIRSFLRERVAAYKVPARVLFFADGEIPLTASATKVRDDALIALVVDRLESTPSTTGAP